MADIRVQGLHSLTFILKGRGKAPQWDQPSTPQSVPSALDQLMSTAKARHLPSQIDVNNDQRDAIANQLIDMLQSQPDWGCFADPHTANGPGLQNIRRLSQVCYWLSPFFATITKVYKLPGELQFVDGFVQRSADSHKSKRTNLKAEDLAKQLSRLEYILDEPCIKSQRFKFSDVIRKLYDQLSKYRVRLNTQAAAMAAYHQTEPYPARHDKASFILPRRTHSAAATKYGDGMQGMVDRVNAALDAADEYEFIQIDDMIIGPNEQIDYPRSTKRKRLRALFQDMYFESKPTYLLKETAFVYRYATGLHNTGHLNFICRVGPTGPRRLTQCFRAIVNLKHSQRLPIYLTRAVKRAFIDRYSGHTGLKPHELTEILAHISGDSSSGSHGELDANLRRRIEMFLDMDEDDAAAFAVDLRKLNKSSSIYDKYFAAMGQYLESREDEAKVNRSRHGSTCDTPISWSIPQLIREVKEHALHSEPPIEITDDDTPSEECVRLAFSPNNPWVKTSAAYTCKFDLRFKVLSRGAVEDHADAAYAARVLKYWRHLACELKSRLKPSGKRLVALNVDDKCSTKIGEPHDGVSALERNKEVIMSGVHQPEASKHDFTWAKANISVVLEVDVPDDPDQSFYRGQVHTLVKDAVFEGSTALRHSTEYAKLFKPVANDLSCMMIYSDGGPDHNVTFLRTILALILLYLALDLDFLIAARTCAKMSWKNAVEKIMCILNLAMYGVVLVRDEMSSDMEAVRQAAGSTMDAIRKAAADQADGDKLKDAVLAATLPVKQLLQSRYNKLELKGVKFQGSLNLIATQCSQFRFDTFVTK